MDTSTFLQTHRVFNLDEAVQALALSGGGKATLQRLKYAAARGKLKKLPRGGYASIPPGMEARKRETASFEVTKVRASEAGKNIAAVVARQNKTV